MSDLNTLAPDNRDLSMFPGEYGLPFLGKTVEFVKDTLAMCNKHYEKYGPVSRLDMVKNQRVLMCLGPEFNEATLFDPKGNFSVAGGYASSLGGLYPDGMLTRDDAKHKRTRRASQPAFKNDALKTYVYMLIPIQERRIQDLPINEEFISEPLKQFKEKLNSDLANASFPLAYSRSFREKAEQFISSIDQILLGRFKTKLLSKGPSPLNIFSWNVTWSDLVKIKNEIITQLDFSNIATILGKNVVFLIHLY